MQARRWRTVAAIAVLALGTLAVSRIGAEADTHGSTSPAGPGGSATSVRLVPRVNPLTPTDPTRIPAGEAEAVRLLGERASNVEPEGGHGHTHAAVPQLPLSGDEAAALEPQLAAARAAALALGTPEAAEAAGYRQAAVAGVGVGTHFVKWSLIDQPFDPARPSMLLFDLRDGRTPQIVGLSYWLRSAREPVGFAGPNDHWHQHSGLCVVNGWIDREQSPPPPACTGTWLAGSDLWMLHAWVVPGWENRDGVFANLNKKLCPPEAGTPDLMRCSFFEGEGGG